MKMLYLYFLKNQISRLDTNRLFTYMNAEKNILLIAVLKILSSVPNCSVTTGHQIIPPKNALGNSNSLGQINLFNFQNIL